MKEFEEKALKPKQKKALEMLINTNKTKAEIANELQITPQTLSNWLNKELNPAFVDEYEARLERADKERKLFYKSKAQHAIDKLVKLVDSGSDKVALAACKEILDRAGDSAGLNIQIKTSSKLADIFDQIGGEGLDE